MPCVSELGSPLAVLDAEPAPGVMPVQGTGGGDSQAGAALEARGILHREGPVGLFGVHVSRAARNHRLATTGGLDDLLVDVDMALIVIEHETVFC